jgi:hypothetical protein
LANFWLMLVTHQLDTEVPIKCDVDVPLF